MVTRVMSGEEAARRYAKGSLRSFLEGGRYTSNHQPPSLAWILGVLESSGIRGRALMGVFEELDSDGDRSRFAEVFAASRERDWME